MEITTTEEVTRTYCDVCGDDITNQNRTSSGLGGKYDYVVCMSFTQFQVEMRNEKITQISCETFAKMYIKYPKLANAAFSQTFLNEEDDD